MSREITWLAEPDAHDFPAAKDYLELVYSQSVANGLVKHLQQTETVTKKAKDILRASRLPLLPSDNPHVAKDLKKDALSPILLVRGTDALIVADGYHRVCAAYHVDEDTDVPCRLVGWI